MEEGTQFTAEEEACLDNVEKIFCEIEKKQLAAAARDRAIYNRIEARLANLLELAQEKFGKPTTSSQRTGTWVQDSTTAAKMTKSPEINRRSQILDSHTQKWQFMSTTSVPEAKSTKGTTNQNWLKPWEGFEKSATTTNTQSEIEKSSSTQEFQESQISHPKFRDPEPVIKGDEVRRRKEATIASGLIAMIQTTDLLGAEAITTAPTSATATTHTEVKDAMRSSGGNQIWSRSAAEVTRVKIEEGTMATPFAVTMAAKTASRPCKVQVVHHCERKPRARDGCAPRASGGRSIPPQIAAGENAEKTDGIDATADSVSLWWHNWEAYCLASKNDEVPCVHGGRSSPWLVVVDEEATGKGGCNNTIIEEKKLGSFVEQAGPTITLPQQRLCILLVDQAQLRKLKVALDQPNILQLEESLFAQMGVSPIQEDKLRYVHFK